VRHGLIPLICIGETWEEREAGQAETVLRAQVEGALAKLTGDQKSARILLAYEPVWAIGADGTPASAQYASQQHGLIKSVAAQVLECHVPCLYGGSVTGDNCQELIQYDHIDGLFIGRSAWDVTGYLDILARCSAVI